MSRRQSLIALLFIVAGCGATRGLDIEHRVRVGTNCPDVESVARDVVYPLRGGGSLLCDQVRVVSGPPYRHATWLECRLLMPPPPNERRGEGP
jgi:hypothetical protein